MLNTHDSIEVSLPQLYVSVSPKLKRETFRMHRSRSPTRLLEYYCYHCTFSCRYSPSRLLRLKARRTHHLFAGTFANLRRSHTDEFFEACAHALEDCGRQRGA